MLLSIYAPWASAAEPAQPGIARVRQVSAEEVQPDNPDRQAAEKRWKDLKARYQGSGAPQGRTASSGESRRATPVRPIPSESAEASNENPLTVDSAEAEARVEAAVRPATAHPSDVAEDRFFSQDSGNLVEESEESEKTDSQAEPKSLESKEPADPGYSPPPGERRLRKMTEITPHYDVNIDEDIREFAKEQAKQYNVEFQKGEFPQRNFPGFVYQWEPSNFYHYPLYFEDVPLERYGHTYHPVAQPFVSIAKFSTQLAFLPYQMTLDPICTPKYVLGYYRPGECAPKLHYQPPLNGTAAAVEAGVVTGLFFAIP